MKKIFIKLKTPWVILIIIFFTLKTNNIINNYQTQKICNGFKVGSNLLSHKSIKEIFIQESKYVYIYYNVFITGVNSCSIIIDDKNLIIENNFKSKL